MMQHRAALFMILSALSFAGMSASVKLSGALPLVQKVFFRNLIILIIIAYNLRGQGFSAYSGTPGHRRYLIARALLGFGGVFCYFFAIGNLYLADATMLNKLSPFFVTLFAALFLGEKMHKRQILTLIMAFSGALLVIKPRFDYTLLPAAAGLLSALLAGAAYSLIGFLKNREDSRTIIFWFSGVSLLLAGPLLIPVWTMPSPVQWAGLLLTGLFAAGGQYFLTRAYTTGRAGEVSVYNYSQILFSGLLGFLIWGEIPDAWSLTGMGLITGAALLLYLKNRREGAVHER